MNDFLRQFLLESRELIEQATDGLLTLERSPDDPERLDAVFRAFHTLKGGAGIVDFAAMERAVHAAEEALSEIRAGHRPLTADVIGECLGCLDQLVQWLDILETSGELPTDCESQADRVVERMLAAGPLAPATDRTPATLPDLAWVESMLHLNPAARPRATVALRFTPDPDCFFRGEDPVARITTLPGLLAFAIEPRDGWDELGTLDPYRCNLVLVALTETSVSDVEAHLSGRSGTCEIHPILGASPSDSTSSLSPRAQDVLKAQIALIGAANARSFAGCIASAGLTAANVLRSCGRIGHAELLAIATATSLKAATPDFLRDALAETLAPPPAPDTAPDHASRRGLPAAMRTVRVDADRVDALVRLTGELIVVKNAFGHVLKVAQAQSNPLERMVKDSYTTFEHLTSELQRSVLGLRVMPLRSVMQRFPRVLRDLSANLGKPVTLQIHGEDTEADKNIVEMLFEPLVHVLRNALDHGVEEPEVRRNRGKPAVATINLRASRQGDQVLIEVSDDGGGVNLDRVREVALRRGVASEEHLLSLSDAEILDLVFAAGFSTVDRVTELSGRGVGMDAVRTAIEKVGGRVALESRPNLGTTVRFALPYSVMMTQVMTVEAGGQMFGVPLDAVVETVRVAGNAIVNIGAAQAIVLRERTLPVVDLTSILGVKHQAQDVANATLVIAAFAGHFSAIRVDRIGERLQIMLKPLEGLLAGTPGLIGTTLLGDGRVLLVLDVAELLQ